jgi:hypothetical protein
MDSPGIVLPFMGLTLGTYSRERAVKSWLGRFGYYRLFPSGSLR